jgi:uncharacterized caspase-like protein
MTVAHGEERGVGLLFKDPAGTQVGLYRDSHALVIGASDYVHWPDLPGVRHDVERVRALLEGQGFRVSVVENPDHAALRQAFEGFINAHGLAEQDRLLFYFAGHGQTLPQAYGGADMGYIVPVDAPLPALDDPGFRAAALDMEQFQTYARRIQSRHALFVFDSCFSGSIFDISRGVPDHISAKTALPVRQFITSGSANERVPDTSIFRQQLEEALSGEADRLPPDGYVTATELGEFLKAKVASYSNGAQHPQSGTIRDGRLDKGDFVFLVGTAIPSAVGPSPAPAPVIRMADRSPEGPVIAAAEIMRPSGSPEPEVQPPVPPPNEPTPFPASASTFTWLLAAMTVVPLVVTIGIWSRWRRKPERSVRIGGDNQGNIAQGDHSPINDRSIRVGGSVRGSTLVTGDNARVSNRDSNDDWNP